MPRANKIHDAMSVGRPVIINLAAGVSQWIVDNQLGTRCRYDDLESLKEIVRSLPARRENLAERAAAARKMLLRNYTWEFMEQRLKELYSGLAAPPGRE
jgi:glycosyltransferase involved in cell wall biosynthesis